MSARRSIADMVRDGDDGYLEAVEELEGQVADLRTACEAAVGFVTDDHSCLGCESGAAYDGKHDKDCIVRELRTAIAKAKGAAC